MDTSQEKAQTMNQHTPGLWTHRTTYTHGEPSGVIVENRNLNIVLSCDESPLGDETYEETKQLVHRVNSHAAMLEALKIITAEVECYCCDVGVAVREMCGKCHAVHAIAQAEGKLSLT
jgi:hypothetical protein